ncbi:MAG: hypothetical protein ABI895_41835 [Deltaproteobacteria bacterium]
MLATGHRRSLAIDLFRALDSSARVRGQGASGYYATLGVSVPGEQPRVFRTRIYGDVDAGESVPDLIELYRGKPRGLVIDSVLQEHTAVTPSYRARQGRRR